MAEKKRLFRCRTEFAKLAHGNHNILLSCRTKLIQMKFFFASSYANFWLGPFPYRSALFPSPVQLSTPSLVRIRANAGPADGLARRRSAFAGTGAFFPNIIGRPEHKTIRIASSVRTTDEGAVGVAVGTLECALRRGRDALRQVGRAGTERRALGRADHPVDALDLEGVLLFVVIDISMVCFVIYSS